MKTRTREDEIRKAIKLIGWLDTSQRIRSDEDRKIFNQLSEEYDKEIKARYDNCLKRHHISL